MEKRECKNGSIAAILSFWNNLLDLIRKITAMYSYFIVDHLLFHYRFTFAVSIGRVPSLAAVSELISSLVFDQYMTYAVKELCFLLLTYYGCEIFSLERFDQRTVTHTE